MPLRLAPKILLPQWLAAEPLAVRLARDPTNRAFVGHAQQFSPSGILRNTEVQCYGPIG